MIMNQLALKFAKPTTSLCINMKILQFDTSHFSSPLNCQIWSKYIVASMLELRYSDKTSMIPNIAKSVESKWKCNLSRTFFVNNVMWIYTLKLIPIDYIYAIDGKNIKQCGGVEKLFPNRV
jgi:hypothetical protein